MRTPQVTRTITTTEVTILGMDIEKAEPMNKTFTVPRTFKDEAKLLKAVKAVGETDTFKVVSIVDTKVNETLYGMSEQEFIEHAHVLPPRAVAQADEKKPNKKNNK
jgi:hypothetical protein